MNVNGVHNGIVLDHIKAGTAMTIYNLLQLDKLNCCVAIIQNVDSQKYGKKDIIKIDTELELDLDMLGYIDSNITVNIVKNDERVKKLHLQLPETLTNVIQCKNPRCITSVEQEIKHMFKLVNVDKKAYRCIYCDAIKKKKK